MVAFLLQLPECQDRLWCPLYWEIVMCCLNSQGSWRSSGVGLPTSDSNKKSASKCSSRPLSWLRMGSFTFVTGRKMNGKQPRSKKHGALENSWMAMLSNRGYCCLSRGLKMPATGMGSWKFSLGKIIHGMKLSCGLNFPS